MRVGIGLPVTTKDTSGELLLAWARRAEEAGFEALTAIDRVVYPGFESLTAMAVDYLFDYYGYQGDRARMFAEGAYRRAAEVTSAVQDFAAIGVDEYVFVPTMADLSQVDLLADAVSRARV